MFECVGAEALSEAAGNVEAYVEGRSCCALASGNAITDAIGQDAWRVGNCDIETTVDAYCARVLRSTPWMRYSMGGVV